MVIRIGLVPYRSIGRLSGNMEYYLRRRARGWWGPREVHCLVAGRRPVNRRLLDMIRRRVRVVESDRLWRAFRCLQTPSLPATGTPELPPESPMWLDLWNSGFLVDWDTWREVGPQLGFTDEEDARGRNLLASLGVPEGAPYVCMHARDRTYTDDPDTVRRPDDPLSYDDFRDCDIRTYLDAAGYLTGRGIWVVRVGHRVDALLATDDPRIIDYAGRHRQEVADPDFADVYLQAHCKFFLGCTAGLYYYSHVFNVPMAFVHMAPLAECGRLDHDLFILKKYWNERERRFMTWRQMIERGLDGNRLWHDRQRALAAEGVHIVDNTADEILALVREMNARLDGEWQPWPGDGERQDRFRRVFPAGHPMRDFLGRIGADFVRGDEDLLD